MLVERIRSLPRQRILLLGSITVALVAGGCVIAAALNWPFTRQRLIDALQESSIRTVTIDRFYQTWFPPGCVAEGVSFLHRKDKSKPPLITIQKITVEGSYLGLVGSPKRLARVGVTGVHVTVPPRGPDGASPVMPLTNVNTGRPIVIDTLAIDKVLLDFVSHSGQKTFELVIDRLSLDGVGRHGPMAYRAMVSNSNPPGEIESEGHFGPWNSDDPGRTPIEGRYIYKHANLHVYKDLSGTLTAGGDFRGELDHAQVTGHADVPDFHLTHSAHSQRLNSNFRATVNATDGNVVLDYVESRINETLLLASGSIVGQEGRQGKAVFLDLVARKGRIEDLLDLFIATKQPPMTGLISLSAHASLPSEPGAFLEKLTVDGDFELMAGKFSDKQVQEPLTKLMQSAQKNDQRQNSETAWSNMKGHVSASNGVAVLKNVSFNIPDADAQVHGSYDLRSEDLDIHGVLRTSGKVYTTSNGFKSVLLRALTPFLKHKDQETFVPFKITGPYSDASVSLDLFAKK